MAGIVVKPRARILHGHDWVFSGEVLKVFGSPADGDVVSLKDGKDRLLGSGKRLTLMDVQNLLPNALPFNPQSSCGFRFFKVLCRNVRSARR